nr:pentatricopeptide repeat-containing protein At1g09190-like [Populus alba]
MAAQVIIPKAFLFFLVIAAFAVVSGQDSESMTPAAPAPATGMEAGAGFSLPVCGAIVGFSLVVSLLGIWPDEYTLAPLLKACSSLGVLQLGKCIHKEVLVVGFEGFSSIRIGVIELYSSCGVMEDAEKVFDEMYQRDVIVWNLMIRGFCKRGDDDMGLCLFTQMKKWSVVSWNIMISCLAQSLRDSEALGLFHDMLDWGFKPDEATVVTVLPICARSGSVDVGKWIHSYEDNVF